MMNNVGSRFLLGLLLTLLLLTGCSHPKEPTPLVPNHRENQEATIAPNADPWNITATNPDPSAHTYLGNGYAGYAAGMLGGREISDPSGFCLVAGAYNNDSLQRLPDPVNFHLAVGNESLTSSSSISSYRQSLQIHEGILSTSLTWQVGGKSIPLTATTFPCRKDPHLVVLHISGPSGTGLKAEHTLRAPSSGAVLANGPAPPTTAGGQGSTSNSSLTANSQGSDVYLSPAEPGAGKPAVVMQAASFLSPGDKLEWTAYTIIETSDDGPDPKALAAAELRSLNASSYAALLAQQQQAWHTLWQSDITISGDAASQQMVHAALFYLLESVRAGSRWSIPPMGLSNDTWGGHIFWDAEMWMFPALALLHPEEARSMVDYRVRMLPQARRMAASAGQKGASYPWESARSGMEAAEPTYAKERHVTADVANMIWRYYICTGDKAWLRASGFPVLAATADYWVSRMTAGPDGKYHIRGVVGPDEAAGMVDDDAFTNGAVKVNLQDAALAARELGLSAPPEWGQRASKLFLPFDQHEGYYLPHEGWRGQPMKQADPELLIYPLELVTDSRVISRMLSFYPTHISPGGPAMTHSIYATIAARQNMTDRAMDFFISSYAPFLVAPFDQISEKHSHVRQYCFITGLGGLIQSAIYGFGGVIIQGSSITARPHLQTNWKSLKISGIHFRHHTYLLDARANQSSMMPQR